MSLPHRPTDNRSARAWVMAFRGGFERSPPQLEPNSDELIGLLELADLRILAEPADPKVRTPHGN